MMGRPVLPVKFSISMPEIEAPKLTWEPSGIARGVTTGEAAADILDTSFKLMVI